MWCSDCVYLCEHMNTCDDAEEKYLLTRQDRAINPDNKKTRTDITGCIKICSLNTQQVTIASEVGHAIKRVFC